MTSALIEFEIEAAQGLKVSVAMPLDLGDSHPASRPHAAEALGASLATDAVAAVGSAAKSMPLLLQAKAVGVTVDSHPFSLREFPVRIGDSVDAVMAPDFAAASAVSALGRSFAGLSGSEILSKADLAQDIRNALEAGDSGPVIEAVHSRFELSDWRVNEGAGDDLTDKQKLPALFELRSGAYGPSAVFLRDGKEYVFALEIDRGCVVARGYPAGLDESWASVRLADGRFQVDMTGGQDSQTYVSENGSVVRDMGSEPLTQDSIETHSPSA